MCWWNVNSTPITQCEIFTIHLDYTTDISACHDAKEEFLKKSSIHRERLYWSKLEPKIESNSKTFASVGACQSRKSIRRPFSIEIAITKCLTRFFDLSSPILGNGCYCILALGGKFSPTTAKECSSSFCRCCLLPDLPLSGSSAKQPWTSWAWRPSGRPEFCSSSRRFEVLRLDWN